MDKHPCINCTPNATKHWLYCPHIPKPFSIMVETCRIVRNLTKKKAWEIILEWFAGE